MLTSVLITSLGLFVRKSAVPSVCCLRTGSTIRPTGPRVDGLRLPARVRVVLDLHLLQRLDRLVLVHKRVSALPVPNEARDNAPNRIRPLSERGVITGKQTAGGENWGPYRR